MTGVQTCALPIFTSGAWEGTVATIKAINTAKQTVAIEVEMFGRVNTVDIAFADIKKL